MWHFQTFLSNTFLHMQENVAPDGSGTFHNPCYSLPLKDPGTILIRADWHYESPRHKHRQSSCFECQRTGRLAPACLMTWEVLGGLYLTGSYGQHVGEPPKSVCESPHQGAGGEG